MLRMFRVLLFVGVLSGVLVADQPAPTKKPVELVLEGDPFCRDTRGEPITCELGNTLVMGFSNLRDWIGDSEKNKPGELTLVLDGRVMTGLSARGPDTQYKQLVFDLRRLDGDSEIAKRNREAWDALLSRPKGHLRVNVGVALGGAPPYFGLVPGTFRVVSSVGWISVPIIGGLLVCFLVLAHRSDILRDAPSLPGTPKMSFSLARVQMAFWFFVVVASYACIWSVTGEWDSLTSSALILIGTSAATGLGAAVIDSNKNTERQSLSNEESSLKAELQTLNAAVGVVPPPANLTDLQATVQQKQNRLAEVKAAIDSLPSPPEPSKGFLFDILRDETGVSFHRFQMAAWTIVLGVIFAVAVYQTLKMPEFSTTLLGLMGISAGTYIGFKIPDPPK